MNENYNALLKVSMALADAVAELDRPQGMKDWPVVPGRVLNMIDDIKRIERGVPPWNEWATPPKFITLRPPLWDSSDPALVAEQNTYCSRGCGWTRSSCRCCGICFQVPSQCRCDTGPKYVAHWLNKGGCWCQDCNPAKYRSIVLALPETDRLRLCYERNERIALTGIMEPLVLMGEESP